LVYYYNQVQTKINVNKRLIVDCRFQACSSLYRHQKTIDGSNFFLTHTN
jgi:hypothetical protein